MQRVALGVIAVLLLTGGIVLHFAKLGGGSSDFVGAVLVKTGAVLCLFWLAYHQVLRLFQVVPPWMIGLGLLALGVFIAFPGRQSFLVMICLFAALVALHYAGVLLRPSAAKKRVKRKAQAPRSHS